MESSNFSDDDVRKLQQIVQLATESPLLAQSEFLAVFKARDAILDKDESARMLRFLVELATPTDGLSLDKRFTAMLLRLGIIIENSEDDVLALVRDETTLLSIAPTRASSDGIGALSLVGEDPSAVEQQMSSSDADDEESSISRGLLGISESREPLAVIAASTEAEEPGTNDVAPEEEGAFGTELEIEVEVTGEVSAIDEWANRPEQVTSTQERIRLAQLLHIKPRRTTTEDWKRLRSVQEDLSISRADEEPLWDDKVEAWQNRMGGRADEACTRHFSAIALRQLIATYRERVLEGNTVQHRLLRQAVLRRKFFMLWRERLRERVTAPTEEPETSRRLRIEQNRTRFGVTTERQLDVASLDRSHLLALLVKISTEKQVRDAFFVERITDLEMEKEENDQRLRRLELTVSENEDRLRRLETCQEEDESGEEAAPLSLNGDGDGSCADTVPDHEEMAETGDIQSSSDDDREVTLPAALRRPMNAIHGRLEEHAKLERRADAFVESRRASRLLACFRTALEQRQSEKIQAAYKATRRKGKINLARNVLQTWREQLAGLRKREKTANRIAYHRTVSFAIDQFHHWRRRVGSLFDLRRVGDEFQAWRQGKSALNRWVASNNHHQRQEEQAQDLDHARVERVAAGQLQKLGISNVQLQAAAFTADLKRERGDKKARREMFSHWHAKSLEQAALRGSFVSDVGPSVSRLGRNSGVFDDGGMRSLT